MSTALRSSFSMQSMESLYSNNSSKFSALHRRKAAARQPAIVLATNSDVRHRVMSARMLRLKQLQNQLEVANLHISELTKDNRLLKALQKRQDSALSKYENTNAELPKLLHSHAEEVRTWQTKYRNLQNQNKELNSKLKAKDAHILTITDQNKHLVQLNKDKHLEERERLADRVRYLENRLMEKDNDTKLIARRLQLETKNFKAQLQQEVLKQREMAQKLERTHHEINRLNSVIEIYEKRTPSTLLKNTSFLLKTPKPSSGQQQQQLVRYTNGTAHKPVFPTFSEPSPVINMDVTPKPKSSQEGEGDTKSPIASPRSLQPISPPEDTPPAPHNSSKPRKKHSKRKVAQPTDDESNGGEKREEHNYDEKMCTEFNQYAMEQEAEFDKTIATELFRLHTEMGSSATKLLKNRNIKQYSATTATSYEDDYEPDLSSEKNVSNLTEIFEHKAHINEIESHIRRMGSPITMDGYPSIKDSSSVRSSTTKKKSSAPLDTNETDLDSSESGSRSSAKELEALKQEMHQNILKKEALLDTFCDEMNGKGQPKAQLNRPKLDNSRRTQIDPKKKQNLLEVLKAIDGDSFDK
ncbi:lebercilin-like protein [Anopheles bellator]|uniref:lebercilin-like protein n=1 Tax=Anopheles bellator TaxID=139047 RepID=UPI002647BC42|nr:lebercilin-like protein [Anopheles bellator]